MPDDPTQLLVGHMPPHERINGYRRRGSGRRWSSAVLPWLFVACVAVASHSPLRQWINWPWSRPADTEAARDAEMIWKRAGGANTRVAVDVIRTIDGDTFEARVHIEPGLILNTRIRLRGIDAPELKAACAQELQMAEAATAALRGWLGEGGVTIFNIGPDKYAGRVVADVATRRTGNVSTAMLGAGYVRSYSGGHRDGWCADGSQALPK